MWFYSRRDNLPAVCFWLCFDGIASTHVERVPSLLEEFMLWLMGVKFWRSHKKGPPLAEGDGNRG